MSGLRRVSDLDLKLLRVFIEIVKHGGLAGAQVHLNRSQSVISEDLKSLEVRLGFRLCQRGPGGFKLLREGEIVYEAAMKLLSAIEGFRIEMANISEETAGDIIVAVEDDIVTNPSCRLSDAIRLFAERVSPRVRFVIEIMLGHHALSRVASETADLAITAGPRDRLPEEAFALCTETRTLYCGSGHAFFRLPQEKLTEETLRDAQYASRGSLEDRLVPPLEMNHKVDVALGAQAHLALVLSGRDIGYLPDHVAEPHVRAGNLRALRPELTRQLTEVHGTPRLPTRQTKAVQRFIAILNELHSVPEVSGGLNTESLSR